MGWEVALVLHGAWGAQQPLPKGTRRHANGQPHRLTAWELDLQHTLRSAR